MKKSPAISMSIEPMVWPSPTELWHSSCDEAQANHRQDKDNGAQDAPAQLLVSPIPQYPKTNRKDRKISEKWPAKVRLTDLGVSWARQDHGAAVLRCVQFSRTTSRPDFEAEKKSKLWKSKGLWIPWIPWTTAIECYRYLWSSSKFRAISTDQFVTSNSETQTLSRENSIRCQFPIPVPH
jgi:hypothetical protein